MSSTVLFSFSQIIDSEFMADFLDFKQDWEKEVLHLLLLLTLLNIDGFR